MSKINKNSIANSLLYGLIILGILAFGAITFVATEANAQYFSANSGRPIIHSLSQNPLLYNSGMISIEVNGENFRPGAVARINNSDRTTVFINPQKLVIKLIDADTLRLDSQVVTVYSPGGGLSNGYTLSVVERIEVQEPANNVAPVTNTPPVTPATNTTPEPTAEEDSSALASNVVFGGDSFMPSGLVQWILLAIFILIIVILARKFFGKEKKYEEEPLKHA